MRCAMVRSAAHGPPRRLWVAALTFPRPPSLLYHSHAPLNTHSAYDWRAMELAVALSKYVGEDDPLPLITEFVR